MDVEHNHHEEDQLIPARAQSIQHSRRWRPIHRDELPEFLMLNDYILFGYRPQLKSVAECFLSIFRIHTETCNIWSHLLGVVGTIVLAIYYLVYHTTDWEHGITFSIFFLGAIICMGLSTVYHVLECHSEEMAKLWAKLDYCGVVVLIVASFTPWLYFAFYCHRPAIKNMYMGGAALLGGICVYFLTQDDKARQPHLNEIRTGLFVALALTAIFPIIHYMLADGSTLGQQRFHVWFLVMSAIYLIGALIYSARIPERIWPGNFDILFHSHLILHICVVGGVIACYMGVADLAQYRLQYGQCRMLANSTVIWEPYPDDIKPLY